MLKEFIGAIPPHQCEQSISASDPNCVITNYE